MPPHRHRLAFVIVTMLSVAAVRVGAQDNPRQLFEAGKYQAAIDNGKRRLTGVAVPQGTELSQTQSGSRGKRCVRKGRRR